MAIILANEEMRLKFEKELQERLDRYQYPIQIVSATTPGKHSTLEQKIGNCARTTSEKFAGAQLHIFVESENATSARLKAIWMMKRWPTVHRKPIRFPLPRNGPEYSVRSK
ncbi:MAG: hypothetical protein NT003_04545 [Candidatus Magasanikbacteria bacterium]|nr:hypothetical protein [Candidatus Magasanikbacteria bacterium]